MDTEEHIERDINKIREQEKVLGIKDWLKVLIIFMIPIVNIVMWIVWLVSEKTNLNLKNYLIASLILIGIFLLLWIILFFGIFGVFTATQI
ncbi:MULTISPECIES: hypothetical protein [Fusobacterium]|jgi:polyferredoxin|uniref:Uncharacterized protein n=1 Tax=Fusobacterium varium ATCC 27725 TaxID=469618 RepID=A0ABM6U2R5_FUSVA|nr:MULTISPECIES: hypothetical protein [Fusobacterium]AVQ30595.1 hypothetical protein C4N18_04930 [Fusobacterium varium ATCC 27725]EES63966.1 hypothetical protein FVAG_02434 [Fusobacterium varium ATCC 27725]MCF2674759.1 hypothetical protein [Fusobacterium varium]MCI6034226.1 hypothetical protein [Fusobacterium varium]MDY4006295.1 hypothetical protein [Fusobacterium varium]